MLVLIIKKQNTILSINQESPCIRFNKLWSADEEANQLGLTSRVNPKRQQKQLTNETAEDQ